MLCIVFSCLCCSCRCFLFLANITALTLTETTAITMHSTVTMMEFTAASESVGKPVLTALESAANGKTNLLVDPEMNNFN